MREAEICVGAAAWLGAQGLDVHGEVQPRSMPARFDHVGLSDAEVVIVEAKAAWSRTFLHQLAFAATCAMRVYAALPWRARAWNVPPEFGVLTVSSAETECVREAPESTTTILWRPEAVRAACSRFTRGQPGGVTSTDGGAFLSPYRVLVFEVHSRVWEATAGKRAATIGEVIDLCGHLFGHAKNRRSSIIGLLEREPAFRWEDGWWVDEPVTVPTSAERATARKAARERT